MGERKAPRLGVFGDYDWPEPEKSYNIHRARLESMRAAARVFPELLETLSRDVFPRFDEAAQHGRLVRPGYDFERALSAEDARVTLWEALPKKGGLRTALSRWAKEFHVTADWLMVGALRTLHLWRRAPDLRRSLEWDTAHADSGPAAAGKPFEFSFIGWEARLQTWAKYSHEVRESFEKKLSEYEKETREMTESLGLIPGRRQYSHLNLEWFVLYQFAGLSPKAIVDRGVGGGRRADESTVLKGIKRAAVLIGWGAVRESGDRSQEAEADRKTG